MPVTGITTMEVRKINRHNVYSFIYEQKVTSKSAIVEALHLSLSTVTQNLTLLETEGLITRRGYFASTGGRKAYKIEIVRTAKVALGIGLLKDTIHLVLTDLYGEVLNSASYALPFQREDGYFRQLGQLVAEFLEKSEADSEKLLGAGIAVQGIVSADKTEVRYGRILNGTGMTLREVAKYIPCPCYLFHDSKAAASAELWKRPELKNVIVLQLNYNFGGALIMDRQIYSGENIYGGLIEHMCFNEEGPVCYCGQRGCLEVYCGAGSLLTRAGTDVDRFFEQLRGGDQRIRALWTEYLHNLSFAIRNLEVLMDCPVILGGWLANYMVADDFAQVQRRVKEIFPFTLPESFLCPGRYGSLAPAIGSALFFVEEWLKQV